MSALAGADAAHLAAIRRSVAAGFGFLHLHDDDGVAAIHAERCARGAVETYTVRSAREAIAARYLAEGYGCLGSGPLWQLAGTVSEVVEELLALPPHAAPGAPNRTLRAASELWLPEGVGR